MSLEEITNWNDNSAYLKNDGFGIDKHAVVAQQIYCRV